MAGIQLSGLATGFDWQSVVDQLMQLERVPINRLRAEQQGISRQLTGFTDLTGKLGDLQQALKAFEGDNLFTRKIATAGAEGSGWTANVSASAAAGSYDFEVLKLATASTRQGASTVSRPLAETDDVSGLTVAMANLGTAVTAGEFTVNGQRVTVDPAESLQDLFDRIGAATGGDVAARYDSASDTILLESADEIVLGSAADSSNFLLAAKLFNNGSGVVASSGTLGSIDRAATLADAGLAGEITAVDGAGNGSFSINGVFFEYNTGTDRIKDIVDRVNASEAGVQMTYDLVTDSFSLRNTVTGDLGIALDEAEGGLLAAFGLIGPGSSLERGGNAEFRVDGGSVRISQNNTFDAATHGIDGLSVTANSLGAQTIQVASDVEAVRAQIDDFISKYNDVQDLIDRQTKITTSPDGEVTTSVFSNNREIDSLSRALRTSLFASSEVLDVGLRRLQNYGIDFASGSNRLEIRDEAALTEALENRPEELQDLFMASGTGLVAKVNGSIDTFTKTNGIAPRQTEHLQKRNSDLDRQVADLERRLLQQRRMMESGFIAMEQAQSRIQQQMQQLTQMLGQTA